ncbi:unnamed protein product [Effrenium voratum]|uniref:Uncharacterized protein n=1 Tax=Effrenium voratum TaxID=2562239 RepID=A0AA36NJG6_9DINO|nr:unnamed protein product [Effrenium voratum]
MKVQRSLARLDLATARAKAAAFADCVPQTWQEPEAASPAAATLALALSRAAAAKAAERLLCRTEALGRQASISLRADMCEVASCAFRAAAALASAVDAGLQHGEVTMEAASKLEAQCKQVESKLKELMKKWPLEAPSQALTVLQEVESLAEGKDGDRRALHFQLQRLQAAFAFGVASCPKPEPPPAGAPAPFAAIQSCGSGPGAGAGGPRAGGGGGRRHGGADAAAEPQEEGGGAASGAGAGRRGARGARGGGGGGGSAGGGGGRASARPAGGVPSGGAVLGRAGAALEAHGLPAPRLRRHQPVGPRGAAANGQGHGGRPEPKHHRRGEGAAESVAGAEGERRAAAEVPQRPGGGWFSPDL